MSCVIWFLFDAYRLVSRARSTARAFCKSPSIAEVIGFAPPRTRRAIRSVSLNVVTASGDAETVGVGKKGQVFFVAFPLLVALASFATLEPSELLSP